MIIAESVAAQTAADTSWQPAAEARFQAIYDRGEFRPQTFQAEWLPDSSGYTVEERDPETGNTARITYQVRTGERSTTPAEQRAATARDPLRSPAGDRALTHDGRSLAVRDLASGACTPLITPAADRDIVYRSAAWSPDGRRVVFVEADSTDVRRRAVIDTSDPTYPGVRHDRFARVGEVIERLRVGVVDADGQHLTWLPIPTPEEGFYLGQVEWAGNSDEVLVEQLSRFRDRRDFFLAKAAPGTATPEKATDEPRRIFHEENDAWTDASQGKNAGLTWIRGGREFVVVNETDGWRHAHRWSRDGEWLAAVTPGDYDLIDRAAIDEAGGWYYFYASPDNATQKYLYRVPLAGSGALERVTPQDQPGTHDYVFSPDARWAFHTYSTLDSPPVVELVELPTHRVARVLEDNGPIRERMKDLLARPTEFLKDKG